MNVISRQDRAEKDTQSRQDDPKKRAEDQAQLAGEAESRTRRIQRRKAYREKVEQGRRAKRRQRAFKLAGVWSLVIVAGFVAAAWFAKDLAQLIG